MNLTNYSIFLKEKKKRYCILTLVQVFPRDNSVLKKLQRTSKYIYNLVWILKFSCYYEQIILTGDYFYSVIVGSDKADVKFNKMHVLCIFRPVLF